MGAPQRKLENLYRYMIAGSPCVYIRVSPLEMPDQILRHKCVFMPERKEK